VIWPKLHRHPEVGIPHIIRDDLHDVYEGCGFDATCNYVRSFFLHCMSPVLCRCYGASGEDMAPWALLNGYQWSSPHVATFSF
jgi:hypothetical protein